MKKSIIGVYISGLIFNLALTASPAPDVEVNHSFEPVVNSKDVKNIPFVLSPCGCPALPSEKHAGAVPKNEISETEYAHVSGCPKKIKDTDNSLN